MKSSIQLATTPNCELGEKAARLYLLNVWGHAPRRNACRESKSGLIRPGRTVGNHVELAATSEL